MTRKVVLAAPIDANKIGSDLTKVTTELRLAARADDDEWKRAEQQPQNAGAEGGDGESPRRSRHRPAASKVRFTTMRATERA